MKQINLDILSEEKIAGLSPTFGAFLAEAASVCFSLNKHKSGVVLQLTGDHKESIELIWSAQLTDDIIDSWKDKKEATEYAATAVAMLLIDHLFEVGRMVRNIGATDYILSDFRVDNKNTYPIVYLEISGIFQNSKNNTVNQRVKKKRLQVETGIAAAPFIVIVVEFGKPEAKIIKQL